MTRHEPAPFVVPENRYDLLAEQPDRWQPTIAVVIPVYNEPGRLDMVLSGFSRQRTPADQIVVADDGSEADIRSVIDRFASLPITYVHQDHDGFGAGRARNLGARTAECDVILFVDADCVPGERLIEEHLHWHRKTSNLVVIGTRYHVDEALITDAGSDIELSNKAQDVPDDGAPDDWRRVFYSRNRWLRTGSDAFRAFVSSNVSVTRSAFETVGGFSERFKQWGGEDTELGWRLWNDGATFAVAPSATVFHQVGPSESRDARENARSAQAIAVADAIPHRFYRKSGSGIYTVPRCSWIVCLDEGDDIIRTVDTFARSLSADAELIVVGPRATVAPLDLLGDNARVHVLVDGTIEDALLVSRGEFVVLVDPHVNVDPRFVRRAVKLMGEHPRLGIVQGPYGQPAGPQIHHLTDIASLDSEHGQRGLPLLALVRRRELMKDLGSTGSVNWGSVVERSRVGLAFEPSDLDGVETVIEDPSRLRASDLKAAGWRQVPAIIGEELKRRAKGD
jgi:GT2 family glycosyltransferase